MAGVCAELFYLILITGCVLYIILGLFTLTGNIVLETYANAAADPGIFKTKKTRLAVQFFIVAGILLLLYILLALRKRFWNNKNQPSFISYRLASAKKSDELNIKFGPDNMSNALSMNLFSSSVSSEINSNVVN